MRNMKNLKTKALVHLTGVPEEADLLKRLALLFDEIHYVRPQAYTLTSKALADESIIKEVAGGKFVIDIEQFNFFEHVSKGWSRLFNAPGDNEILSVLNVFEEAGIAFEAKDGALPEHNDFDAPYNQVRMDLIGKTLGDSIFERLSGTIEDDYDLSQRTTLVTFAGTTEDPNSLKVPFIYPPKVIADVDEITSSIFIAETYNYAPIFHVERHRLELSYFYDKFINSLSYLRESYPEPSVLSDQNSRFGEVAFNILNATVSPTAMARRTPQEIISYDLH